MFVPCCRRTYIGICLRRAYLSRVRIPARLTLFEQVLFALWLAWTCFYLSSSFFYSWFVYNKKSTMPRPLDPDLYDKARRVVNSIYKKPSAFRSGALVKLYKHWGGRYADDHQPRNLSRWFKEKWQDVNPHKTKTSYPVFRPTVRVNSHTPLLVSEIDPNDFRRKSKQKQKIRGEHNLKPFKKKIRRRRA